MSGEIEDDMENPIEGEIKAHAFCFDCEQIFNKKGEDKLAKLMYSPTSFALLRRLKNRNVVDGNALSPLAPLPIKSANQVGYSEAAFSHFALGIVYKALTVDWPRVPRNGMELSDDLVEKIRLYRVRPAATFRSV
jgi:hypothetical protein